MPAEALKAAASKRAGSLNPYQMSTASFDVSFVTPLMTYGAQYQSVQAQRTSSSGGRTAGIKGAVVSSLLDFGNWSEYAESFPPVLLVRVTPKQVESFWTTVARGAAQTQGVAIPKITHFNGSFARMRAYCGDTEVTPIHPFKIERQISDTASVTEGLYAFDPNALGPQCSSVKLSLYSEKEPDKEDSKLVDPRIIEQISKDFEPYRTSAAR